METRGARLDLGLQEPRENTVQDTLATFTACALIAVVGIYVTLYDVLPVLQVPLNYLMAALSLGLVSFSLVSRRLEGMLFGAALALLAGVTFLLQVTEAPQNYQALIRYLTSLAGLFGFSLLRLGDIRKFVGFTAIVVISCAALIAIVHGGTIYAGTARFTPFWTNIHSSALLIAAMTIIVWMSPWSKPVRWFWSTVSGVLVVGYGVITAALMLALFLTGLVFARRGWRRIWLYVLGVVFVTIGIFVRDATSKEGIGSLGIEAIGSGRLGSWLLRIDEFSQRDFSHQMVGGGPYTDIQVTEMWWWEAKNAHSDLITLLMEFGVFGLLALLLFAGRLYSSLSAIPQMVLLSIALGTAISNALLDRPSVAIAWGLALYMCIKSAPAPGKRTAEYLHAVPDWHRREFSAGLGKSAYRL